MSEADYLARPATSFGQWGVTAQSAHTWIRHSTEVNSSSAFHFYHRLVLAGHQLTQK